MMVKCGDCGTQMLAKENKPEHERIPCPECGSLSRTLVQIINEDLALNERHRMKLKAGVRTTSGRPGRELIQGHDYYKKLAVWNYLYRLVDRINNLYHEKICDLKTGRIIRECKQPLDEHRGHGSAKQSGSSSTSNESNH